MKQKTPWSQELVSKLRELAEKGFSAKEIAREMKFPEPVVRRQAHLYKITIHRAATRRVLKGNSKASMQASIAAHVASSGGGSGSSSQPIRRVDALDPDADNGKPRVKDVSPGMCTWPIGHPNQPDFGFCGEKAMSGKPYCAAHQAVARVKTKPKVGESVTI